MVHDPNTRGKLQGIFKEEKGTHTNEEDHAYRIEVMGGQRGEGGRRPQDKSLGSAKGSLEEEWKLVSWTKLNTSWLKEVGTVVTHPN